jgi:hypothetical protein
MSAGRARPLGAPGIRNGAPSGRALPKNGCSFYRAALIAGCYGLRLADPEVNARRRSAGGHFKEFLVEEFHEWLSLLIEGPR